MSNQANRIKERRLELHMTQEDLAAAVGKDQKQIWRYENGQSDPTGEVLAELAKVLDTTADWLLGLTDIKDRPLRCREDLSQDERDLIEIYRRKPSEKRRQIVEVARVI